MPSDNFDRGTGLGANWSTPTNFTTGDIQGSIQWRADNDPEGNVYTGTTPAGADYSSQVTLRALPSASGKGTGPAVRWNATANGNCYFVQCNTFASERMSMYKVTGGGTTYSLIASSTAVAPASGDTAKLTIQGTTLTFNLAGTDRITQTDGTLTATGGWGLVGFADASERYLDDWIGTDIGATAVQVTPRGKRYRNRNLLRM